MTFSEYDIFKIQCDLNVSKYRTWYYLKDKRVSTCIEYSHTQPNTLHSTYDMKRTQIMTDMTYSNIRVYHNFDIELKTSWNANKGQTRLNSGIWVLVFNFCVFSFHCSSGLDTPLHLTAILMTQNEIGSDVINTGVFDVITAHGTLN